MASFPASLPKPALNSFKETPPDNVMRSNMDKGPAKTRRRSTANVRPLEFSLKLSDEQTQILDDFYTMISGDEFDYIHPRTGANVKARFTKMPQYFEQDGAFYLCPISLEVMP